MKRYLLSPYQLALLAAISVLPQGLNGHDKHESTKEDRGSSAWAEIHVVDAASGRGVPLAELETVNSVKFVTDNAGRVAFQEPGLLDREVFFFVQSHSYAVDKDGFGFSGVRITPKVGRVAEIKVHRKFVAERLCRLTGEGRYRDTILLGYKSPLLESPSPGRVAGQDSIQAAIHRDKVYWFWGDTLRMEYPLGLFRMAGATTPIPDAKSPLSDPAHGIAYTYFVDKESGFARAMMPLPERPEGVVWVSAVFVVPDNQGVPRMVGHYTRRKSLADEVEQGIAVYNDEKEIFESVKQLTSTETWRKPTGHPIHHEAHGKNWIVFGSPNPNVRVPATLQDVLDPSKYQALTCQSGFDAKNPRPDQDKGGRPNWRWQSELPPTNSQVEIRWIKSGQLKPVSARFAPANAVDAKERVELHSGSVRWNEYRKRWILLACQVHGTSSHLGEVWYAESQSPNGPFAKAVKVLSHDKQTFYNVCHHAFLDRTDGRIIHFEGTYTNDFSGNPDKTPRYNYNQVLYRLDLANESLRFAHAE